MDRDATAVVVLAGGRATRFPGKLAREVAGEPMLQRVCRNARATGLHVYVCGSDEFSPAIARGLGDAMLLDRWPGGGPLRALASACAALAYVRLFALAGDAPAVDAPLLQKLDAARQHGDEAIVPRHGAQLEPLAALYERGAVLREAPALLASGRPSMHALLDRLQTRVVDVPGQWFANVNAPADLAAAQRAAR